MKACHDLLINGQWQAGLGDQMVSREPTSQEVIWQGHGASSDQVKQAIMAAHDAFDAWRKQDVSERLKYLHRFEKWSNNTKPS